MSFALVNPLGWAMYELLTSSQMNQLDQNMSKALDGDAGGVYTPSETLELDGAANSTGSTPTVLLKPSTLGPAIELRQSIVAPAFWVTAPSSITNATQPSVAARIAGAGNTDGPGGDGLRVDGGAGGSIAGSAGGRGIYAQGATSQSGDGGQGVLAIGGSPKQNTTAASGAGVAGAGGSTSTTGAYGGPGIYGVGSSGNYGDGPGGMFEGISAAPGVVGRGAGNTFPYAFGQGARAGGAFWGAVTGGGYGVFGVGGGGYSGAAFYGDAAGAGVVAVPGASSLFAMSAHGQVSFGGAAASAKNPDYDTPQQHVATSKNMVKAWGIVRDGALVDGFNISSVAVNGSDGSLLDVTLAYPMASTDYAVFCGLVTGFAGDNPRAYSTNIPGNTSGAFEARTTTFFQIQQTSTANSPFTSVNWTTNSECYFMVLGEQS